MSEFKTEKCAQSLDVEPRETIRALNLINYMRNGSRGRLLGARQKFKIESLLAVKIIFSSWFYHGIIFNEIPNGSADFPSIAVECCYDGGE